MKQKYNTEIWNISITAICLSITVIGALLTSMFTIPIIPIIGGRPDFWYGLIFISLFFLKSPKYKCIYIVCLPLILLSFELTNYQGLGDYFLEACIPLVILVFSIFTPEKKIKAFIFLFLLMMCYMLLRFLMISLSGFIFWGVDFRPSLIYNAPNILSDFVVSAPLMLIIILRFPANQNG